MSYLSMIQALLGLNYGEYVWPILELVGNVLLTSIWGSMLLLIFTLTSSPYNTHNAVNVLKTPGKSPRKNKVGTMTFDDANDDTNENMNENSNNKNVENNKDESKEDITNEKNDENEQKSKSKSKSKSKNKNDKNNKKLDLNRKRLYKTRKAFRSYFRMFLTNLFILPILIFSSFIVNIFQVLSRLSHPIFEYRTRMWLASWFGARWTPVVLFAFELWPNLKYRIRS